MVEGGGLDNGEALAVGGEGDEGERSLFLSLSLYLCCGVNLAGFRVFI